MRNSCAPAALATPLLLALAFLPAGGCALLPFGGGPTAAPGGGPSPMGRGLRDFRVAFHCHSRLSHDSKVPFDRIAASARDLGFNAVVLDDHYEPGNIARAPHGPWDGILFVPGVELRPRVAGSGGTGGSILAFGIERDFDPSRPSAGLLAGLRAGGSLVAWGHAEEPGSVDLFPIDAFEVYNLHAQFKAASRLGLVLGLLFLPSNPFFQSQISPSRSVIQLYDAELRRGKRLAPLAGHDAHENVRLFGPLGGTIGTYPELLRLFSNHVLATELSAPSLLDAIRRGRVYISFDFLGDGTGFSMSYGGGEAPEGGEGPVREAAILGDEAPWRPASVLEVQAPAEGTIRILRDGSPWKEVRGRSFSGSLPGPGVWRVEVHRRGFWGNQRLWILSSPLYLKEEP